MNKRKVHLNSIYLNSISYSSIFEIGDTESCHPVTKAIAVQQEDLKFQEEAFDFADFDIFSRKADRLASAFSVKQENIHHSARINVGQISIIGASSSSVVQIGSLANLHSEARIKHIRVLKEEQDNEAEI
ncbi:spore germination protein GerPE [Sediminibacillus albus]|uniref:Spore germination protein PE n=1 Tax=Sediminibacillus albus TaxID=407036 RepID=A0A1G8XB34_9BACI|nr:spore germination protein GerPE [Sediminibacillus albus]SDJ87848.1 spore germination protein PE [Sediminibacillus albus]